jgi:hypothetical protein
LDDGTDTEDDDEKGKSHRLRYGSKFSRGGTPRSHNMTVRSAGQGALNNDAPSPTIDIREKSPFLFRSQSPLPSRSNTRLVKN